MNNWDKQYIELCERILRDGERVQNRTGVDTIKVFGHTMRFNLAEEFPILTSKFVAWKSAILEMMWIYQVQSNDVNWLTERGVKIWNEWAGEDGTIGTAYGWIVKRFGLTQRLINTLKTNPQDRRMVMSLWQDEYLATANLPSCVWNSQWNVTNGKLNLIVTQRSCDVALGLPFNVTQYAILAMLIAQVTGHEIGEMLWVINDAHLYVNQLDGINAQIEKYKQDGCPPPPKLWINPEIKNFFAFDNSRALSDIKLENYEYNMKINMPVAV